MSEAQRQRGKELIQRLSDSSYFPLGSFAGYPAWLRAAASQILAITGDAAIIHAGHTLEDYDVPSFMDVSPDAAAGQIRVLTEKLLVTTEFTASEVRTTAFSLRNVDSVTVTRVTDIHSNVEDWPDRVAFELNIAGTTLNFPATKMASQGQQAELPAALTAVLAATMDGK